jgi:hypothetical protein
MATVNAALRLSAQPALLGAIPPQVRLIKIKLEDSTICLSVIAAEFPIGISLMAAASRTKSMSTKVGSNG